MKPVFYKPSPDCSVLVSKYIFIGSRKDTLYDRFIPDGKVSLVFNFSGNVFLTKKNRPQILPPFFLVTPYINALSIKASAPYDTMVVICNASVFSRLLKIPLDKFPHTPYKTADPFSGFPLWDILKSKQDAVQRIKMFEDILRQKILIEKYEPDIIDKIYDSILKDGCKVSVKSLMEQFNINPRTFRRNFLTRVGINSKGLIRITRVNYIWDKITQNPSLDLYNIMYECKFFDQSHFIRDFKNITGEAPGSFFTRDLEQVKILSGKQAAT